MITASSATTTAAAASLIATAATLLLLLMVIATADAKYFKDITKSGMLPKTWEANRHSKAPYMHINGPQFADLNHDGCVDWVSNNHHAALKGRDPCTNWDFGYFDPKTSKSAKAPRFKSAPADNCEYQRSSLDEYSGVDSHGTIVADFDGDKILDLLVMTDFFATVSNPGFGDNVLMWGSKGSGRATSFKGGRKTARNAGLDNQQCRSRGALLLDANGDGKLDIFFQCVPAYRLDGKNLHRPGKLMLNKGNRKFQAASGLEEYSHSAIVTDADKDGKAEELMIFRYSCMDATDVSKLEVTLTKERRKFCTSRKASTFAIYKWDKKGKRMKQISKKLNTPNLSFQNYWNSEVRYIPYGLYPLGDTDGDTFPDYAVMQREGGKKNAQIWIILSKKRPADALPELKGTATFVVKQCEGRALRVGDYNGDTKMDFLLICNKPGTHVLFLQGENGKFQKSKNVGDLTKGKCRPVEKRWCDNNQEIKTGQDHQSKRMCAELFEGKKNDFGSTPTDKNCPATVEGASVVDANHDGFPDIVLATRRGFLETYINEMATKSHKFLKVKLEGNAIAYAIGATLKLEYKEKGVRTQFQEVNRVGNAPDGLGGQDDLITFLFDSKIATPKKLTVQWPSGGKSEFDAKSLAKWTFAAGASNNPYSCNRVFVISEEGGRGGGGNSPAQSRSVVTAP